MYYCNECGKEFETPLKIIEEHRFSSPPYEVFFVCPNCKSTSIYERDLTHCQCCGAKLKEGQKKYCGKSCEEKGEKLWEIQLKLRKLNKENSINKIILELNKHNKENDLNLSYGQYVSILYLKKEKRKIEKRKKAISKQISNSGSKNKKTESNDDNIA